MTTFLEYAFLFFIGSVGGWILELLFRRFFSAHRWVNPGFLTGPYLPLYGFGLALLHFFCKLDLTWISSDAWVEIIRLVIIAIALTLIEYIAGIIFIKGMHIKLWDYSDRWGNIQGIICPLFTLFWTFIGALYMFVINPYIVQALNWFYANITFSFVVGIFFGFITIDFASSMDLAVKLRALTNKDKLVVSYEKIKDAITEHNKKFSARFLTPIKTVKNAIAFDLEKVSEILKTANKKKED